jgi:hypothetical protein
MAGAPTTAMKQKESKDSEDLPYGCRVLLGIVGSQFFARPWWFSVIERMLCQVDDS